MTSPPATRTAAEQRAHLAREIVETLLLVGLIFLVIHFTIQTFRPSGSEMSSAVKPDQIVLVNKMAYAFGGPSRGDVVLMADPSDPSNILIRRVIAIPGDTITLNATQVIVNGTVLKEPYVSVPFGESLNTIIVAGLKLPQNQYYVMCDSRLACSGDPQNRGRGGDSRSFGVVPRGNVLGKVVVVFWPLGAFHWVSNYSDVFSHVPNP